MDVIVLIGRIAFALVFVASAYGHLTQTDMMAGYAAGKGVPAARATVVVSGVVIVLGGLMVAIGVWADLGALLLFVFLVPTAVIMHGPWRVTDPQEKQMEQIQFVKDLALAGAALMLFAFFATTPDLGLTVTGPLLDGLFR